MPKLVKIDFENDHHKSFKAPDDFKVHDVMIDADKPGSWLVIPTESGGHFCTRAGLVVSIGVEDEAVLNGGSS